MYFTALSRNAKTTSHHVFKTNNMILLGWSSRALDFAQLSGESMDDVEFPIEVSVDVEKSQPWNIVVKLNGSTASLNLFEWLDAPTEIFELIKKWK
jgi:hypothetical protein